MRPRRCKQGCLDPDNPTMRQLLPCLHNKAGRATAASKGLEDPSLLSRSPQPALSDAPDPSSPSIAQTDALQSMVAAVGLAVSSAGALSGPSAAGLEPPPLPQFMRDLVLAAAASASPNDSSDEGDTQGGVAGAVAPQHGTNSSDDLDIENGSQ